MSARGRSTLHVVRNSYPPRPSRLAALALVLGAAVLTAACGGAAPSAPPSPTPVASPTPTPNPHLAEPASIDAVFTWLNGHALRVIGNNADAAMSGEPVKRINATYAGWPLILSQYSTSAAARKATGVAGRETKATADQPTFTFVGLNIVVDFGPRLARATDPAPDARFLDAATALAAALDPILGPLGVRAAVHVALPPGPTPAATAGASVATSPAPSSKPTPTPKPTATAKPKTTAKPKVTPKPSG
jgi:hypothetical protein